MCLVEMPLLGPNSKGQLSINNFPEVNLSMWQRSNPRSTLKAADNLEVHSPCQDWLELYQITNLAPIPIFHNSLNRGFPLTSPRPPIWDFKPSQAPSFQAKRP